jgi:hypothetical protein
LPTTIHSEDTPIRIEPQSAPAARPARRASIRQADDQPILSIRASVPKEDSEKFIADALHDIRVFMQEHHVPAAGPPFSICRSHGSKVDVEAGWPTIRTLVGTPRIHAGAIPRSLIGPRGKPDSRQGGPPLT